MIDYLVNNNYYIINNNANDEFNILIYYISYNKCKILIRRLDNIGWGQDLKIVIEEDTDNKQQFSLGSCEENIKILEIYTNITLTKYEYKEQIIPKIILQICNENIDKNIYHYNSLVSFYDFNKDYDIKLFNNNECRLYIMKMNYIILYLYI